MTPIVNGLEAEYDESIVFQKLDANTPDGRLAMEAYRLRGHPAIVLIDRDGGIVWTALGPRDRDAVASAIKAVLVAPD